MSLHLPYSVIHDTDEDSEGHSGSEDEDDDDQTWDAFGEDSIAQQPCFSLFEDRNFSSVTEALEHDRSQHGFDLDRTSTRLGNFAIFPSSVIADLHH